MKKRRNLLFICLASFTLFFPFFIDESLSANAKLDLPILVKKPKPKKAPRPKYVPDEIIVKFKPGVRKEEIESFALQQESNEKYESPHDHFKVLKIPKTKTVEEMVEIYRRNPNVEYAEPNYYAYATMVPNDPLYLGQWHLDNPDKGGIQMQQAWNITTGLSSVIVAVIDTGVAYENYSPGLTHWHRDTYNAYGGTGYSWWCGVLTAPATWPSPPTSTPPGYGNSWHDYLQSAVDLTLATGTVTLTYQRKYDTEPTFDFAYVEISDNNGVSWAPSLKTYTGFSTGLSGWAQDSIDLTAYKGKNILLRFIFYSDDSFSDEDGEWPTDGAFYVDEIRITDSVTGTIFYDNVESGPGTWQTTQYQKAPDLAGTNFWVNSDELPSNGIDDDGNGKVDDVNGWDFINSDAHPNDDNSHGTHITGTIAQTTNNSLGVAGVAFNTTIMPVKVLSEGGSGTHQQVADGIYYAVNNGAKIINLSLGGDSPSIVLENAVAYAYNNGVTVIAASGNGGDILPVKVDYPAAYDAYVIAVGATRYNETRAFYSDYGPSLDLVAPGGDVFDDLNLDGNPDGVLQNTFGKTPDDWVYAYFQGTSMATPHVCGVAALLLALNSTLTPTQVRNALQNTADDLGTLGLDNFYGYGLVNAYAALLPYISLGVSASPNYWNMGNVAPSSVTTMTSTNNILIQNQGNVRENFSLQITNTGGTWSAATTENGNAANTFVMSGLFTALADSIVAADFNEGTDDDVLLSANSKTATSTIFGNTNSTAKGFNVSRSEGRYLWMQFKAPTSSITSTQQTITVTVGAEQAQ